jgi:hypothetical protein
VISGSLYGQPIASRTTTSSTSAILFRRCPSPKHDLRNGRLNQTADSDLIGWIDQRLQAASSPAGPDRLARMRDAIIAPLREIYGVSDKVLAMALSSLLLGAPNKLRLWREVGASMIAIEPSHSASEQAGVIIRSLSPHISNKRNRVPSP